MHTSHDHRWGIVLAAGEGSRLRDFVQARLGVDIPKQFAVLTGTRSLLRHSLDRARLLLSPQRIVTVVHRDWTVLAESMLSRDEQGGILAVPANRETGPNVLLGALRVRLADPDASVAVFPSDHFVLEEERFMRYVESALEYVERNPEYIVLLGVEPERAEQAYGWIELRAAFDRDVGGRFYHVQQFHEKPGRHAVQKLYEAGAVWNTMLVVGKVQTLIGLYRKSAPEMLHAALHAFTSQYAFQNPIVAERFFASLRPLNFSKHVLEGHPNRLRVLCIEGVRWSDWGTGERVEQSLSMIGMSVSKPSKN